MSKKLENSFNFSAGESQNKAQMRLPSLAEQNFQRAPAVRERERRGRGTESKDGENADDVEISAFGEFLIGWMGAIAVKSESCKCGKGWKLGEYNSRLVKQEYLPLLSLEEIHQVEEIVKST